jgi:fucose 4-O-acetylase-like acetyltransferase
MKRDARFDVIKGVATLLVIVGHVMQYTAKDASQAFAFNVIWSLQIPLFILLSGYFSTGNAAEGVAAQLGKRAWRYFVPFVSFYWINDFLYEQRTLLQGLLYLARHLETSLWYLFVLLVLNLLNGIAEAAARRVGGGAAVHTGIFFGLCALYGTLWPACGSTFLGVKYVVYYSVFFWLGWLWRNAAACPAAGAAFSWAEKHADLLYGLALCADLIILRSVNLYEAPDTPLGALPRALASVLGCFVVMRWVFVRYRDTLFTRLLSGLGRQSLELYYVHCLIIRGFGPASLSAFSPEGILVIFLYSGLLLVVSLAVIRCIRVSGTLNAILFGGPFPAVRREK